MILNTKNSLNNEICDIDVSSSSTVSLTSQLLSCNRLTIIGPNFCISDPDSVSTRSAKFGAKKCSTESCANFSISTANWNENENENQRRLNQISG